MSIKRAIAINICVLLGITLILFVIAPWRIYESGTSKSYLNLESVGNHEVALVFGAGITASGQPSDALRDRLDTALDLYNSDVIEKILLSGDNSIEEYSEPDVMKDYLISQGVPEYDLFTDYAGRRTYDSCARANEVWGLEKALLITQGYHLPRAIYLCEKFGIESRGISASRQEYVYQNDYEFREILAIYKAVLDIWILHPDYIGGPREEI
jgi:vancomycin permeability regulator SanA